MRYLCGILFVSLFLAASANAQMSGRISGSVIDASGAAVGGADVELYLAGGQKPLLVSKTSAEGLYNFIGVRPAEYDLSISAKGFLKTVQRGITVDMARETDVPRIKLELAGVTQSVDVSARGAGSRCGHRRGQHHGEHGADQESADSGSRCACDHADEAGSGFEWQLLHRDQRAAHQLLQHDAGRHQHTGQLHPRQRAGLLAQ